MPHCFRFRHNWLTSFIWVWGECGCWVYSLSPLTHSHPRLLIFSLEITILEEN